MKSFAVEEIGDGRLLGELEFLADELDRLVPRELKRAAPDDVVGGLERDVRMRDEMGVLERVDVGLGQAVVGKRGGVGAGLRGVGGVKDEGGGEQGGESQRAGHEVNGRAQCAPGKVPKFLAATQRPQRGAQWDLSPRSLRRREKTHGVKGTGDCSGVSW